MTQNQHTSRADTANMRLPTIFVSIANYRDTETPHTLRDLFAKAHHPERIRVGVFSQVVEGVDDDCLPNGGYPPAQVRELRIDAAQGLGACWARSRILRELLGDEDFVLQIDSHSRFTHGWDDRFIAMLGACASPQAILTTYPPGYMTPNNFQPACTPILRAMEFNSSSVLLVMGLIAEEHEFALQPQPAAFLSANCLFGPAKAFREVPYDPWLYFHGEEISLAVRLWTHGWDLFAPNDVLMYSEFGHKRARPLHWTDQKRWGELNRRSFARLRHLFQVETSTDAEVTRDFEQYGLGTQRSLRDYEAFADVCFATRYIGSRAYHARFPFPQTHIAPPQGLPTLFVSIASYRDPDVNATLRDLFARASYPQRIIAGVLIQALANDVDCKVDADICPGQIRILHEDAAQARGVGWARHRILTELMAGEDYILQIDSHSRFAQGWDEYLLATLGECPSTKAVISGYPSAYTPGDSYGPAFVGVPSAATFVEPGILAFKGHAIALNDCPKHPISTAFVCAGSLFAPAQALREVPYDPHIAFLGEECALALRLWTHGWDIFTPNSAFMYHDYSSARPHIGRDRADWAEINARSKARVRALLVGQPHSDPSTEQAKDKYGLGTARSLAEYEAFADVHFQSRHIGVRALDARFPSPLGAPSQQTQRLWQGRFLASTQESIETRSGDAARISCTHFLRAGLDLWLKDNPIQSLVDAGCGDLTWVRASGIWQLSLYMGYDIVPELIMANQACHVGQASRLFAVADITCHTLPRADAALCRRVLNYMDTNQIANALYTLVNSGATYLLATTHPGAIYSEETEGVYRAIDLCAAPFLLPAPLELIADYIDYEVPQPYSKLGIWKTADIAACWAERSAG